MLERPLVAVTLGDPSGIGPEVVAKALTQSRVHEHGRLFVIGNNGVIRQAIREIGSETSVRQITTPEDAEGTASRIDVLEVADLPTTFPTGELSLESAQASHAWAEQAAELAISGDIEAMVTAI